MLKVVRWDDNDAIIYYPLGIFTTVTLYRIVATISLNNIVAIVAFIIPLVVVMTSSSLMPVS
jgi:hypothetical protein